MSENTVLPQKRKLLAEIIIVVLLVMLAMTGIGITDFSPNDGYAYWLLMVIVFALFAMLTGWLQSRHQTGQFKKMIQEQALHWCASLLVVGCAFLVQKSGRMDAMNAGLIISLILSLSTILDGIRIGWRFSLIGFFLGAASVITTYYNDSFFWINLMLAIFIIVGIILLEVMQRKAAQ
ncbi:MAG: hypothetical protein WC782_03705 [Methylococcaceae bacterium]|jgi:hypothetical protein